MTKAYRFLLLFIGLLCALPISARDFTYTYEGQTLTYTVLDEEAKTCKTKEGTYYSSAGNDISGNLTIPSVAKDGENEYSVISIGQNAFYGCSGLTKVTIPNSVTSIGDSAFYGCSGLTEVTIGNSVTEIGWYAFYDCNGLTKVTIPNSVTEIGNSAFNDCSSLKELIIEDGEETLKLGYNNYNGKGLFYDCPLESIYLGRNLSYYTGGSYSYSPFYNQTKLTSLTIGDTVTTIGDYAFYGCYGLTKVTIPNSVTSIGDSAFYGCSGMTEVTIGDTVTTIGDYTFYGCSGLTEVTIGNSVTSIGNSAFYGCSSLKELIIEDGEETLKLGYNNYNGKGLFYDCPLESIYLGRNLSYNIGSSYGYSPFYNQTKLTNLTIGDSVTTIGDYAFYGCYGLTKVTIPNSVISIGNSAFNGCSSLKELIIEDGEETLKLGYNNYNGKGLFYDCPLESIYLGRNLSYNTGSSYGYSPFYHQTKLTSLTIGDSVTEIGEYAFNNCNILKIEAQPEVPPTISENSFDDDTYSFATVLTPVNSLEEYKIKWSDFIHFMKYTTDTSKEYAYTVSDPGNLINLIDASDVDAVVNLKLTGSLNGTDFLVLNRMVNIESLDLSEATIVSGGMPYYDKDNERFGTEDNTLGQNWAYNMNLLETLKLPQNLVKIDSYALNNKSSIKEIFIPNSVTTIGNYAFNGCSSLKDLIIEDSEEILSLGYNDYGKGLFYDCPLETIYLGRNISYSSGHGYSPFYNKKLLKSLTFGNNVSEIKETTFCGCSSLTYVSIPDPVTQLYSSTFYGCSSLKEIVLPGSMREIAADAFSGCNALERVTVINPIPPVIESSTFEGCPATAVLYIPEGSRNIYWIHPYWGKFKTINNLNLSEEFNIEDLAFRITSEQDATVEISGASLAAKSSRSNSDKLEIPSEVTFNGKTYRVTGVANKGFADLPIGSVYLPETISYVGLEAFKNTGLTAVNCMAALPPSANANSFDTETYQNARLTIPENGIDSYNAHEVWQKFVNTAVAIRVQSLTLDPEVYEAEENTQFQITATVLPENATDKTLEWSSSDESVATVNQTGLVTILKEGECVITARTTDGSALQAECRLSVRTDVDMVTSDTDVQETRVYNLNGVMISDSTENLAPGIYIVVRGTKTRKIIVK